MTRKTPLVFFFGSLLMVSIAINALLFNDNQRLQRQTTETELKLIEISTFPTVFEIYKEGDYTCVNITSLNLTIYKSLSSSESVQWAIDNVLNGTTIDIIEDIEMDGEINLLSPPDRGYSMYARGGYLVYNFSISQSLFPISEGTAK